MLVAGDAADGFGVSGGAVLTNKEFQSLPYRELACRKILPETDADYQRNHALCMGTSLQFFGAEEPIRLMHGYSLSRVKLKPNSVGSIGDWTSEYALGSAVQLALQSAGLAGYATVPIKESKTNTIRNDVAQLYSESVLPASARDASIDRISSRVASENGKLRMLGCLAYDADALLARPDFNRTAEPWMSWWGFPSWVVSSRVAEVFKKSQLRGWAFRPVFVVGTPLYRQYIAAWERLRTLVLSTRKSKFEGGRW